MMRSEVPVMNRLKESLMTTQMVTEVRVLPTGATVDDDWGDTSSWVLSVKWCGPRQENGQGGYGVTDGFRWLSRAQKWAYPERFQRHQYRWETMDEAIDAARAVVDDYKTNGWTFAYWVEHKDDPRPARTSGA